MAKKKDNDPKTEPLTVQLVNIRTDRFNLSSLSELLENYKEEVLFETDALVYDFKTKFHFKPEDDLILCVFTLMVRIKEAHKPRKRQKKAGFYVAIMDVQYDFAVPNLSRFIDDKSVVDLPEILAVTINSIALSTTRGIWFEKSSSTYLGGRVLHIIDPRSFKKDG